MITEMSGNIYLIGLRGAGKTTIGKLLAEKLGRSFLDTDDKIVRRTGKTIPQMVNEKGWEFFREQEKALVEDLLLKQQNAVIAAGGGLLMSWPDKKKLKESGVFILLTGELSTLVKRIESSSDLSAAMERPPLTEKNLKEEMKEIWDARKDRYNEYADIVIDTEGKSPEEITKKILDRL